MNTVSYMDVVSDFAVSLNNLAPKVEKAMAVGSLTQAVECLNDIDMEMETIKHMYHRCMFVRDKLRKEGYGRIKLLDNEIIGK